jgi:hypothetical protein
MAKERREHACSKYRGDGSDCRRCGATLDAHERRASEDYEHWAHDNARWNDLRQEIREVTGR